MEDSGFLVIDRYLMEKDNLDDNFNTLMSIDQQVPAPRTQGNSTSGGFVTVSSWSDFQHPAPAMYPQQPRVYPPSPSNSPNSTSSWPSCITHTPCPSSSPPTSQWGLEDIVKDLAGPSPGCTLTEVCDQQVQPEDSPDFIDMDAVNFYPSGGAVRTSSVTKADPLLPPPLVKMEPQDPTISSMSEEFPEEFQQQLIRELSLEISYDSDVLQIDRNPALWSEEDVKKWIDWTASKRLLTNVQWDNFYVPGSFLCNMSEEDFRQRDPQNGISLYLHLSFWKVVQMNQERTPLPAYLPPSPGCSTSSGDGADSLTADTDCSNGSSSPSPPPARPLVSSSDDDLRLPEGSEHKQTIHLWQFLKELLNHSNYKRFIRWVDRVQGIFKIEDSVKVAKLWGMRKNRPAMNYDKLSRSVRQYYKKGIIKKTAHSKRLVYQFCAPYL